MPANPSGGPTELVDYREELLAELVTLEQMAELAHRRFVRRRLTTQINAGKAAHRRRVVQGFLDRRVRQVEPLLQEVHPQHPLQRQRQRREPALRTRLRVERFDHGTQLCPRHHPVHLREELRSAGRLAVLLKTPSVAAAASARSLGVGPCFRLLG